MSTIHGERQGLATGTIECTVESKAANDENWPCAVNRQENVNQPELHIDSSLLVLQRSSTGSLNRVESLQMCTIDAQPDDRGKLAWDDRGW